MGQIQELDASLERAVEAYNLANVKLARIRNDLADNTKALAVARKSLSHAQTQLSARLVDIYTSGDQNAGLAVCSGPRASTTCSAGWTRATASPSRTRSC